MNGPVEQNRPDRSAALDTHRLHAADASLTHFR
jgi:hypothetical protein